MLWGNVAGQEELQHFQFSPEIYVVAQLLVTVVTAGSLAILAKVDYLDDRLATI